jgi:hypothetical protein
MVGLLVGEYHRARFYVTWWDNLFSHMSQVADAHVVGLLFGAGQGEQTSPETDGGNLIAKTISYWQSGGTQLR